MLERLGAFGRARIPKNYTPPDPPSTPSTCLKRIYRFSGRLREIFQAPAHPAAVIIGFLSTVRRLSVQTNTLSYSHVYKYTFLAI
eukprot:919095-Amorphochlora_amoeboformis.AAC.2